jgi:hypothetical protein
MKRLRPIYRLYIDESGDHSYGRKKGKRYPRLEKKDKRYLGLTGCIFKLDYYRKKFIPTLESFKREFFDPDEHVILHAKDIIQRRGAFYILRSEEVSAHFDTKLLDIIATAEYKVINVVIDKKSHVERYGELAWHPYHYCLRVLLERYCLFLSKHRARGDVMAESRGKTEDYELKKAYREVYENGTWFKSNKFFQQYLTSKEIKIKPKNKNVAGLQLADMLAKPLRKYTLIINGEMQEPDGKPFWKQVVEAVTPKLDCRESDGCVDGYGLVFLK